MLFRIIGKAAIAGFVLTTSTIIAPLVSGKVVFWLTGSAEWSAVAGMGMTMTGIILCVMLIMHAFRDE
jgi:NAD(P)H-hydrate repair Nnr-like enzyme with NAD(P)H-hydrate dehydratase domain